MIHLDLETRGIVELKSCGSWRYSRDPQTDVWCLCYFDTNTSTSGLWLPGQPVPDCFLDPFESYCAWNAQFERNIHANILVPRYGFEPTEADQWHDTAAWARQLGLPGSLAGAAIALGFRVDEQKDKDGQRLMLQMAKPRSYDANGQPVWWQDDEVELKKLAKEGKRPRMERLIDYCQQDVNVELAIRKTLSKITERNPCRNSTSFGLMKPSTTEGF